MHQHYIIKPIKNNCVRLSYDQQADKQSTKQQKLDKFAQAICPDANCSEHYPITI